MTDARVDEIGEEDRLPWLEAVEEESDQAGPPVAKLIAAIVIGLIAIAVIVGGLFWLGNRNRGDGNGEIIAAPQGDYKVRPDQPGGMNVAGEGDTAYAASEGAVPQGQLNTNAVREAPVARQPQPAQHAAAPNAAQNPGASNAGQRPGAPSAAQRPGAPNVAQRPAPQPAAPQRPQPAPAPAATGATIQLGAFSSQAGAQNAWHALSGRFRYLAPLGHSVIPVQSGGRTLYRLRANGADAGSVCRRLQVAGEDCTPVG